MPNPSNPNAHYENTAQEILDDLNGKVDMVVIGAGTGGTITGVARKIKEKCPDAIVVGADPVGSILAGGGADDVGTYKVEGIGYDFIPDVLDGNLIDKWIKTKDRQSFQLSRRLIMEEGLLCGGSSGSALYAALKSAGTLKTGQNCVVILPDGVRNYMTKFVDDKWMLDNNFSGPEELDGTVNLLLARKPDRSLFSISKDSTAQSAIQMMRDHGISQLPVINDSGALEGVINEDSLLNHLAASEAPTSTQISAFMERNVPTVETTTPISSLQGTIFQSGMAIVVDKENRPLHILTKIDLVEWMSTQN